jgi:hypothetical protein
VNREEAIRRATLAAQKAMNRLDAQALAELEHLYLAAGVAIRQRIEASASSTGTVGLEQLQGLLAQVNAQLASLGQARNDLLGTGFQRAAQFGTEPLKIEIAAIDLMRINTDAVAFVRNFVAADGLQLSDRLWRVDRQARDQVGNVIESAVIQGRSAVDAARELLGRGEPVPPELDTKVKAANAGTIGKQAAAALTTGESNPMANAMRVARTELNRAHGEAFAAGAEQLQNFAGFRFKLSPAHPKHDICDLYASQNLYGLGPGVYPDRQSCPWPAHPNTLSYIDVVFTSDISAADQEGKQTPAEALAALTPEQRRAVSRTPPATPGKSAGRGPLRSRPASSPRS